jgi:hypothetical protein
MDTINYSNTFDCCGKRYLTLLEYIKARYYSTMLTKDISFADRSYRNELFGKQNENWNSLNYIHYFWGLMEIMYAEIEIYNNQYEMEIIEEDDIPDATYYRDKYDLECIRKTLKCVGIDILPLLSIIGLNYVISYQDGIDYMSIIPNPTGRPDFWIR